MWICVENVGINHFEISTPFSPRDECRNLKNFYSGDSFTFFPSARERFSEPNVCEGSFCVTSHNTDLAQKSYDEGKENKNFAIIRWDKKGARVRAVSALLLPRADAVQQFREGSSLPY